MQLSKTQICIIEDDEQDVELVQDFLDDMPLFPCTLQHRGTLTEGIKLLQDTNSIDLILLDLTLSDAHGLDTFYQVQRTVPEKPLIIVSGNNNQSIAQEAMEEGAQGFLVKGTFNSSSLYTSIQHALGSRKQQIEKELQHRTLRALRTQLELVEDEINKFETLDTLGKVYDRTRFDDVFLSEWKRLQREGKPLALVFCELDLTDAEKALISLVGKDQVMQQVAEVILNILKRPADVVARYRSDQFILLLPNTDVPGAIFIAQNIRTQLYGLSFNVPNHLDSPALNVSIGVTGHIPKTHEAPTLLVEAAHQALAKAKVQRGNQIEWQTLGGVKSELYSRQTLHWVGKLQQALQHDLFHIYVQPIHSLEGVRKIVGYEVLLRICDQSGRVCAPELFLPMIEQYDFMAQLDMWAVENLLLEHTLVHSHAPDEAFYILKLSEATCKHGNLAEFVHQKLKQHDFPPHRVGFKISVSTALNYPTTLKLAQSLKSLGCKIVLEDFGVDLKTFNQLKKIDADYVKITEELIKGITTDPILREILDSINRVAKIMNWKTIAGGVESVQTLATLREVGVDYAQGSFYENAMPFNRARSLNSSVFN